jgi:hypothetical protein
MDQTSIPPPPSEPTVTITAARLAELEEAEAKLKARNAKKIEGLKKYKETHPDNPQERYARYIATHRDEVNARRRELYKQKTLALGQTSNA